MRITYRYVYYWLYTWQKRLWGEDDIPEHNAALGMAMSLFCLLYSVNIIIYIITDIMVIPTGLPKVGIFLLFLMLYGLHYLAFIHRGKHRKIEKEFKNESRKERRRKGLFVLLYTFGSMAFVIILLFLLASHSRSSAL